MQWLTSITQGELWCLQPLRLWSYSAVVNHPGMYTLTMTTLSEKLTIEFLVDLTIIPS